MSDINATIERVLELDDKATKGPWRCTSDLPLYAVAAEEYDIANSESRRYRAYDKKHLGMREKDARLIAEYRTLAPILARELQAVGLDNELLRLQLAACGVAAMCNTEETIDKQRIGEDSPYWSDSYRNVCNAVDREMELQAENERLREELNPEKVGIAQVVRVNVWELKALRKVVEAARKLHHLVGDGDNGPLPCFQDAWYELDEVLKELERE